MITSGERPLIGAADGVVWSGCACDSRRMTSVSPDALIERARESTGLTELGSHHFHPFLHAWCADLAAPHLSEVGRARLAKLAVRNLETRLRIEELLRRYPQIEQVPLPRIVRIGGFPRSGTTLLHQLMSLPRDRRALLRWELVAPLPPPDASAYLDDPRIAMVSAALDALRGSDLARMHWVEATEPEECTWGFVDLTGLLGRGCLSVMPRWTELLYGSGLGHRDTYVEYRRLLQILLWRNPLPTGGTLVLKSPTDTDSLPAFLDVFPEATAVLIHRDPFRTVTSSCQIQRVINQAFVAGEAPLDDAGLATLMLAVHARLADAMVALSHSHPQRVTNLRYADLMAGPAAAVTDLAHRLELAEVPSATRVLVDAFLETQRAGTRAAPPAAYSDFGLTPEGVHAESSLSRYMAEFHVATEHDRTTAPARA